jgi:hypothetical protein
MRLLLLAHKCAVAATAELRSAFHRVAYNYPCVVALHVHFLRVYFHRKRNRIALNCARNGHIASRAFDAEVAGFRLGIYKKGISNGVRKEMR